MVKVWSAETGWTDENGKPIDSGNEMLKQYLLDWAVSGEFSHSDGETLHKIEEEVAKAVSLNQAQKNEVLKACAREWAKLRKSEREMRK